jgi:hypothetical protein
VSGMPPRGIGVGQASGRQPRGGSIKGIWLVCCDERHTPWWPDPSGRKASDFLIRKSEV